jgi:N-acetyl-anhydromuramyl-L-alanine amidase AmpD
MATEIGLGYTIHPPKSYTSGRKAGQPTVIFIHTTEGSEGPQSAEDGAAYDARRTDGTSTHFFVDSNSIVQCVRTTDEAHAARTHGNDVGIQIEVCGRAGQTAAQWADTASANTIEQLAELCVKLRAQRPGRFPLVNLTPAQLRAGDHGFAEHKDATLAWPVDDGTHTDPGPNFPWAKLFARITEIENPPKQEDTMSVADAKQGTAEFFGALAATTNDTTADDTSWGRQVRESFNAAVDYAVSTGTLADKLDTLQTAVDALAAKIDALTPSA